MTLTFRHLHWIEGGAESSSGAGRVLCFLALGRAFEVGAEIIRHSDANQILASAKGNDEQSP